MRKIRFVKKVLWLPEYTTESLTKLTRGLPSVQWNTFCISLSLSPIHWYSSPLAVGKWQRQFSLSNKYDLTFPSFMSIALWCDVMQWFTTFGSQQIQSCENVFGYLIFISQMHLSIRAQIKSFVLFLYFLLALQHFVLLYFNVLCK